MKKHFTLLLVTLLPAASVFAQKDSSKGTSSQVKDDFKEAGTEIKDAAVKVGHKTAEISVKAFSSVKDKKVQDKTGPGGQTIYQDSRSRYYYINEKGGKVYITSGQLKNK